MSFQDILGGKMKIRETLGVFKSGGHPDYTLLTLIVMCFCMHM